MSLLVGRLVGVYSSGIIKSKKIKIIKMKKFSSIILSVTTTITLTGVMGIMPVAHAQSIADLQAQIVALQAMLAKLQGGGGSSMSASFTRDLTVGSKGDDVQSLQVWLNSKGYTVSVSGPGSSGNETMYFGPATRAAVAKYQAASGISPAVGYFGPKTRASVNAMAGGPVSGGGGGGPVVVPGSGLAVSLASDTPAAGASVIAGASRVNVLSFNMTAGSAGAVTVNSLKFKKVGVISDTLLSAAYLVEDGNVVAQYVSISNNVVDFGNPSLVVNPGQNRHLTLAVDLSSSAAAGNTLAFNLDTVKTFGDVPVNGVASVVGNSLTATTVSNPSLATLTIASASVGTSVYAGTQNVLVSQWTLTGSNNPVNLKSIKFKVIGSANKSDVKNVKLFINGSQVGTALAQVDPSGDAFFNLMSAPAKINTGSGNMQVYADIMGSPSYTIQFELLNTYDVLALDSQYNQGVAVTINGGAGVSITINQGQITLTTATDTPTGSIALGGSGTVLSKFTIYAAGEAVKVKFLDFSLTFTGTTNATLGNMFKNVALIDDTGLQVGSTINTPPTTLACNADATPGYNAAGTVYNDCFGSSASPINYIVPANTARTLSLVGDVQTTAAFTTVVGSMVTMSGTSNLQGLTSSQTASSGSATGATRTLATTPLSATLNGALGTPTYARGAANVRVGSYTLTAASAEAINVSNMTITFNASSTQWQNAMVKVGSTQFGTTKSTLSGSDVVTFSGSSAIVVPKGGSVTLDIYADLLSSANLGQNGTLTTLTSCTGTGGTTNASVNCSPTSVAGQSVTTSSGPTVTISIDQATASAGQAVMGSTGLSLATIRLTDTANIEPLKITDLTIRDFVGTTATTKASFTNITLWQGNTQVGGPLSLVDGTAVSGTYKAAFSFGTPIVIPQDGTVSLTVKGDVATFTSNGASENTTHSFRVRANDAGTGLHQSGDATIIGQSSNGSATITLSTGSNAPTGNTQTVLRTKLTLSGATLGATSGRTRTAADEVASLTFTADPAYDITVNSVALRFQGVAVSNGTLISARLIDPSTGSDWSGLGTATCTSVAGNTCSIVFSFTTIPTITAGTSKTVKVRVDSSSFFNAANSGDSMSVTVNANTDINWGDGSTTNGLNLEAKVVPLTISAVSYE